MKICIRFSLHPRFYGYSYRDEMVADAIYTCLSRGVDKIDPDRPGSNPFSYFTAIAFNCFRGRINSEKKFMETKKRFRENKYNDFEQQEGLQPDLIDYYDNISFPYPLLLKIVSRYYTKKESDIIHAFHGKSIHNNQVNRIVSDRITWNGVVFEKEDQYQIVSWLHENNYPVTYEVFMDKVKRIAKEKNKQKHL